jgi:hypothetical protein
MVGQGPVTHHHTRKETLLPNKETIKAPEVAVLLQEQACSFIYVIQKSLASREPFSKIGIQWECKSKSQCKNMLQIALRTHIPYNKHLKLMNIPSHFRRMIWYNLTKALQEHSKENSNHQNNLTMGPNRVKWHQHSYQRL